MLLAALLATTGFGGALAQTSAPDGPASAPAPAASASLNVADTVAQIAASAQLQRAALARIERAQPWHELAQRTTALQADFDRLELNRADQAELVELLGLEHRAWALKGSASAIVAQLASILRSLERDRSALEVEGRLWQERRSFLRERQVPEAVLDRTRVVEAGLQATGDRVQEVRDSALLDLVNAFTLQARTVEAGARISARLEQVRAHRMELETASLWRLDRSPAQFGLVAVELGKAAGTQREYLAEHGGRLAVAFFGILALSWWLFTRKPEQDLGPAQHAYGRPVAGATLVALMLSVWWAPAAPIVFYMLLLLLTPIPAAMLARRSFATAIPLSLYGLAFATVLLALRNTVEASPIADRALLLLQTLGLGVPVAIDLHRGRLQQAFVRFGPGAVRLVALIVIAVSAGTALHVFVGFSGPARSLRAGAGSVMGYGLVFGATALALYGLALALLARPPLCWLRSARAADPDLLRALRLALGVAVLGGVAIVTLGNLRLTAATLSAVDSILDSTWVVGAVSLPATAMAAAIGIALATLILSAVTEFMLDREVFPRLQLRPGVGYAIATFTRWVILIVGTLLALAALGIDTTKLTLVAGGWCAEREHRLRAAARGQQFRLGADPDHRASGERRRPGRDRAADRRDQAHRHPIVQRAHDARRRGHRAQLRPRLQGGHQLDTLGPPAPLQHRRRRGLRFRPGAGDAPARRGGSRGARGHVRARADGHVPWLWRQLARLPPARLRWVSTIDLGPQAQTALRIAVLHKLEASGIEIPFPQRDVHLVAPPAPATPPKARAAELR
jgi:hypothetical protein